MGKGKMCRSSKADPLTMTLGRIAEQFHMGAAGSAAGDRRGSPAKPRNGRLTAARLLMFHCRILSARFYRRLPVKLFCLALLLGGATVGAAQYAPSTDDYVVTVWDTDSGLPDNTVTSIAQTPDGYLWVGTQRGGLARFDGTRFTEFNPGNTPQLRNIEMHQLLVAPSGTLWIGNVEGGLISHQEGRFQLEYLNNDTPPAWVAHIVAERPGTIEFCSDAGMIFRRTTDGASNRWETMVPPGKITSPSVFADESGTIWYRTTNGGLAQLRGSNSVILRQPPGLAGPVVNALGQDALGRIWAATPNHLAFWNGNTFVDATPTNGPSDFVVWGDSMLPCPGGGFWMVCDGFFRQFDGRQWAVIEQEATNGVSTEWPAFKVGNDARWFFADSAGGLWFWRQPEGLGHLSAAGRVSWVRDAEGRPLDVAAPFRCWCEDHEGNVWVGLTDGGLARLRPRVFHVVWPAGDVNSKAAKSVCQGRDGAMWFGSGWKDVLRWDERVFQKIAISGYAEDIKVYPGVDDRVWVGSAGQGLFALDNGQFSRPFPSESIGRSVRCLYRDGQRGLWIGNDFGLFRWDGTQLQDFTMKEGFAPAFVTAITGDAAGNLWIGTALGELRRLRDGQCQSFVPDDSLTDRSLFVTATSANPLAGLKRGTLLGGEPFDALHANRDGVVWIGSLGGGLLRFKDGRFTRFTTRDGLPSDHVNQILEDNVGWLWLGTRAGIVRVNQPALNAWSEGGSVRPFFIGYDRADGLPALECPAGSQPNCWRARDGRLWFTTVRGAVWVDPSALRENRLPPPVSIEDVRVDGASILETNGIASSPAARPANLRVAPGRHFVEFKFTALSFISPEKVLFKWRLAGLDQKWVAGDGRRTASYNYLPPGAYRFEVLACNNDGYWGENPDSVAITVMPFFWQRWWFKAASGGSGLAMILGVVLTVQRRRYRVRMQVLERQNALEQERTRIARDIHDQVGANLTKIGKQTDSLEREPGMTASAQTLTHEVGDTTREMLRSMDEIVWAINPHNDTLRNAVHYLIHYTRDFLRPAGIAYQLDVPVDLPSLPLSTEIRHNFFMAFKEALNNAVKHGHPRSIRLVLVLQPRQLKLLVEDDGCGFAPAASQAGADGLDNMRQRLKSVGGDCQVESAPGQGTKVTFQLPLPVPPGPDTPVWVY
jgi:signal transduction histidine kinase/ligand-binding sensor domain-containing protein